MQTSRKKKRRKLPTRNMNALCIRAALNTAQEQLSEYWFDWENSTRSMF